MQKKVGVELSTGALGFHQWLHDKRQELSTIPHKSNNGKTLEIKIKLILLFLFRA